MSLISILKTNDDARKIFGQREIKIIEKQLLGINLTQSEKNRLSRDIRKKFDFIKEASVYSKEFELKKGSIIRKIVEETKEVILNDILSKDIIKIILYGSTVENKRTFNSDIDMAVEFTKIDLKAATEFRKRISGKADEKVDIQVLNILPKKIIDEITSKGRILYERTH